MPTDVQKRLVTRHRRFSIPPQVYVRLSSLSSLLGRRFSALVECWCPASFGEDPLFFPHQSMTLLYTSDNSGMVVELYITSEAEQLFSILVLLGTDTCLVMFYVQHSSLQARFMPLFVTVHFLLDSPTLFLWFNESNPVQNGQAPLNELGVWVQF